MKKVSFCGKKFNSMLFSATIVMIVVVVLLLSDLAIAGNIIGEKAVAAINLLRTPYMLVLGLSSIISQGSSLLYSLKMGEFDKKAADKIFGQGLLGAGILCGIIFILYSLGLDPYFSYLNTDPETEQLAKEYARFYIPTLAIYPMYMYIAAMVYTDGDEILSLIANLFLIFGNIGLSIAMGLKIGMAGVALGSFVGVFACTAVTCLHFIKKTNSLKPKLFVSLRSLWDMAKYSFVDAGIYIYFAVQSFILTKLIITQFGVKHLEVYSVIVGLWQLTLIFDGVGQAFCPLVNVYRGEGNIPGIQKTMRYSFRTSLIEGLAMTLVLFAFADFVPVIFDIQNAELATETIHAVRICSVSLTATSILFLLTSYYLLTEKITHAVLICFFKDLFMPTLFAVPLALLLGLDFLWVGLALAPAFALGISIFVTIKRFGKKGFPLYVDNTADKIQSFNFIIEDESVVNARDTIEKILTEHNASKRTIMRSMLLIEELFMLIKEKNPDKKVTAELTVFLSENSVKYVIRDDGIIFDITEEDDPLASIRGFIVASMMHKQTVRKNLTTTSFNRNMFVLPLQMDTN